MSRSLPNGSLSQRSLLPTNPSHDLYRKFTLTLDCDILLKPDVNRPGIYTSKSAEEAVESVQLHPLLLLPTLDQIKIKLFHCGQVELQEGACLETLKAVGDWFVGRYRDKGKSARYEISNRGRADEWSEPDAILSVTIEKCDQEADE